MPNDNEQRPPLDLSQFAGHTPGPLICLQDTNALMERQWLIVDRTGRTIAIAAPYSQLADGVLFAAAPTLLAEVAALRQALGDANDTIDRMRQAARMAVESVREEHNPVKEDGAIEVLGMVLAQCGDGHAMHPHDHSGVPSGAVRLPEVYWHRGEIVVIGTPVSESHNCDEMGCTSVAHVAVRAPTDWMPIPTGVARAVGGRAHRDNNRSTVGAT